MTEIPELTEEQFARALPARVRKRLMMGQFESGEDISALRRFVGLTQVQFAARPNGPAEQSPGLSAAMPWVKGTSAQSAL